MVSLIGTIHATAAFAAFHAAILGRLPRPADSGSDFLMTIVESETVGGDLAS